MKRGKKMLLLLAVLVLCIGGYYGAQLLSTDTSTVTEEAGNFVLNSRTADELTSLAWTLNDESYAFTQTDGTWTVSADPAFPLDQTAVQSMADDLLALMGVRQLDGVTDLNAYGLSEPAFSVTANWTDGTSTTYAMGDATPFGDGYYLSLGHQSIVYTIDEDISASFDVVLNDLAVLETLPSVTSATRLTVGTALDIVKVESSRTINASELWYDSLTGAALDASTAAALMADAQALAWAELAEPTASDEELAAFGLDEASATAITLYEDDMAAMTLLIGTQDGSGNYYARLPGSTMVYTIASSDVSSLLTATAESMPSMVIIDLAAENVQCATFTAGDASYTWIASTVETTAEADGETADTADAEPDEFGAGLWESLLALEASSRINVTDGTPLLKAEVTTTDTRTAELTFTEHDAQSYAVTVQDRCFLVDAADVDAIIRTLRTGSR